MEEAEKMLDDDDVLGPRGFLNKIYQDDNFLQIKGNLEHAIIENTKLEIERKDMLNDAD